MKHKGWFPNTTGQPKVAAQGWQPVDPDLKPSTLHSPSDSESLQSAALRVNCGFSATKLKEKPSFWVGLFSCLFPSCDSPPIPDLAQVSPPNSQSLTWGASHTPPPSTHLISAGIYSQRVHWGASQSRVPAWDPETKTKEMKRTLSLCLWSITSTSATRNWWWENPDATIQSNPIHST